MTAAAIRSHSPAVPVESTMRRSVFASRGFARPELTRADDPKWWDEHHARIDAIAAVTASRDPKNWSPQKQLAMLLISRGTACAIDCIRHLHDKGVKAGQHEFAELRSEGYATRALGNRYHTLTASGIRLGEETTKAVAQALGLHHIEFFHDSMNEHKARCTCGWSASSSRLNNRSWQASLQAAASRHTADPQAWIRGIERSHAIMDAIGDHRK